MAEDGVDAGRGRPGLSRRALLTGVGTGAALMTAGVVAPGAAAAPRAPQGDGTARRPAHPDGAPIDQGIGSAPIDGFVYHTACMYDFQPFDPTGQRTWGGSGVYTAVTSTPLRATIDVPAGALVRDVEWYVYNSGASTTPATLFQYAPGAGLLFDFDAQAAIPSGTGIAVVRVVVPEENRGPLPIGSKVLASITTPTDGSVQVNGVRVGFSRGSATVGLLPTPVRVFDNRKGGRFHPGSTHVLTLHAADVPVGTTGVLVNVTAVDGASGGALTIWPANAAAPPDPSLRFGSGGVTEALTVGISAARQLKIRVSKPVHLVVDLVGTMS